MTDQTGQRGIIHLAWLIKGLLIIPSPDKLDKCVYEVIFCLKNAENDF